MLDWFKLRSKQEPILIFQGWLFFLDTAYCFSLLLGRMFSSKIRRVFWPLLMTELVLVYFGIRYQAKLQSNKALISEFNASSVYRNYGLDNPQFPASFSPIIGLVGIDAVSTGNTFLEIIKDGRTGEELGEAVAIKAVARDDFGFAREIDFAIQFKPLLAERNVAPWIAGSTEVLTPAQISGFFPRGDRRIFVPLIEADRNEFKNIVEYKNYIRRYYGGSFTKLNNFLESGLEKSYRKLIFVLDVVPPLGFAEE